MRARLELPPPPTGGAAPDSIPLPRIVFAAEDVRAVRNGAFDDLELRGAVGYRPQDRLGHPDLPALKLDVIVPAGKKIRNVRVVTSDPIALAGSFLPRPIQRDPETDGTFPPLVPPDSAIYNSPIPYPPTPGEVVLNGSMRGYRIGTVMVRPIQYVGAHRRLVLQRSVDVEVVFAPLTDEELAGMRVRSQSRRRNTLEGTEIEWIRSLVRNPDDLDRFYRSSDQPPGQALSGRNPLGGFEPTEFPSTDGPPVEYVIVTDSLSLDGGNVGNLVAEFQRLADWKTRKGTPAVVRTVGWIRTHYPGIDDPGKIRSFLIDAFRLWGTDYVLLGGDLRIVPARRFTWLSGSPGDPPAEVYFGGLDNDWDADNDGLFGEFQSGDHTDSDPFWDVWVGRAPVDTQAEAVEFVNRTLKYSRTPGQDLTKIIPSYYARILCLEGLLSSPFWGDLTNGMFIGERIARYLGTQGVTPQRHYQTLGSDPSCTYHETYLETSIYNPFPWTSQGARDSLSNGFGFVHHAEHSNPYEEGGGSGFFGSGICATGTDGDLGREDIDRLTNAPNYSVVFSYGSGVNAFDYESVSENWILNPQGGAVAYMGKTRSIAYGGGVVDTLVFRNIVGAKMTVGQALAKATESTGSLAASAAAAYALLGDPELRPWTAIPAEMALSVSPATFTPGDQTILVTARDALTSAPLAGARAAIKQSDRLYGYDLTDAEGQHLFDVAVQAADTIFVVVTATNYSPARIAVPRSGTASRHVVYKSHAIDDAAGNANGIVDAGEEISLDLEVENIGTLTASSVTGKLYAESPLTFRVTIDSRYKPNLIWLGSSDQHPADLVTDSTFAYPDFHGIDFRGRPAKYDTSATAGLFVWRDRNLWNMIARGDPPQFVPQYDDYRGHIIARGGISNLSSTGLEANDVLALQGPDTLFFHLFAASATDEDAVFFVAREANWLTVIDSTGTFGDLPPNSSAQDRFIVKTLKDIADRHEPVLELVALDALGANVGSSQLTLPVAAPVLTYLRQYPAVDLAAECLDVCELIAADLKNVGSGVASNATAILTRTAGTGTVTDNTIAFGQIPGLSEDAGGSDVFRFETTDTTTIRFRVDITNVFPDGSTKTWTKAGIDVVRPSPPSGVFVEPFHGGSETVRWLPPAGVQDLAGYTIHRRLASEPSFVRVATAPYDSTVRFQDVQLLADTTYIYTVASLDSSGNESALHDLPFGNDTWLPEHPGWPKSLDAGTPSSPVAVDIDGDGAKEMFATGNSVYAWRADGSPVIPANPDGLFFKPSGPLSQPALGRFWSSPAAGDLNGDNEYEIVVSAWDDALYVLDEAGNVRWKKTGLNPLWSSPVLGDIDGDATLEVFQVSGDKIFAWRHDGAPLVSGNPPGLFVQLPDASPTNYASPSLANIDGVAGEEIFFGTNRGNAYVWKKPAGQQNPTLVWSRALNTQALSTIAIGDVDNDGTLEAVVAHGGNEYETNALYILSAVTGATERSWAGKGPIRGKLASGNGWVHPPSLADLDANGDLEVVVATSGTSNVPGEGYVLDARAAQVLVFEHNVVPGYSVSCLDSIPLPGQNMTSPSYTNSGVVVANLDYDADHELVAGSETFGLFMWDEGCRLELGWPITIFGEVDGTPLVGDVDGDGFFEMVVKGLEGHLHLYDLRGPYAPGKVEWGQFAHDSHHSSRYGAAVGGLVPEGGLALFIGQNAPNPFNPMTRISYGLPNPEWVQLIVYDVRGRAVRRLVSGWQSRGNHEVEWDGTDERGRTVGSGVYLYRLEASGTGHTKKMLLLR